MLLSLRSLWEATGNFVRRGAGLLLSLQSLVEEQVASSGDVTVHGTGVAANAQIGSGAEIIDVFQAGSGASADAQVGTGVAGAASERAQATRRNRRIQRELQRLARWSEAVAPPVVLPKDVFVQGSGIAARPRAGEGRIKFDVFVAGRSSRPAFAIGAGTIVAEVDLFEEEIAALLLAA